MIGVRSMSLGEDEKVCRKGYSKLTGDFRSQVLGILQTRNNNSCKIVSEFMGLRVLKLSK